MAVPNAFGLAAPSTAKPIRAAATESSRRLLPDAISPRPSRAAQKNAADRGEDAGNDVGPDLVGINRRAREPRSPLVRADRIHHPAEAGIFQEEPDEDGEHDQHHDRDRHQIGQYEIETVTAKREEGGAERAGGGRTVRHAHAGGNRAAFGGGYAANRPEGTSCRASPGGPAPAYRRSGSR